MAGVIKIDIIGDTKGLRGAVSDSEGLVGKLGSSLAGLAKTAAIAGAAIGAALAVGVGKLVGDSISAASDLNESLSKGATIFGDWFIDIEQWADQAASAIGMTKQQAIDAAAGFATFAKAAGLGQGDVMEFSKGLTNLASDLASFFNSSPEEAAEAIGAALRGESEPIRKYGIMLDAASVKAKAFELGLVSAEVDVLKLSRANETASKAQRKYNEQVTKFGSESQQAKDAALDLEQAQMALADVTEGSIPDLDAQSKLLATQALILDQTGDAQGDFAKTSGGLANQQRILSATFGDLKAQIGQAFLPVVLNVTKALNEGLLPAMKAWWSEHGPRVQEIVGSIGAWIQGTLLPALGSVAMFIWERVVPALGDLVGWVRDEVLPRVKDLAAWVRDDLVPALQTASDWIRDNVVPRLQDMAAWIGDHIIPKVAAFADWVRNQLWPALKDAFAFVRDTVIPDLEDFANRMSEKLQPAVDTLTDSFRDDVLPLLEDIHSKIKPLGDFISNNLVPALQAWWAGQKLVMDMLLLTTPLLTAAYKEWDRVASSIRGAVREIVEVGKKIEGLSRDAYEWGVEIILGLIDGMLSKVGELASTAANIAGDVKGAFTDALSIRSPSEVFKEFGRQTMAGYEIGLGEGAGRVAQVMPAMVGASIAGPAEAASAGAGGAVYNVTINGAVGDERALMQFVREGLRRLERAQR